MRNQKSINVAKFSNVRWKQEDGIFKAESWISRKPFGYFIVKFSLNPKNGETEMSIESTEFSVLSKEMSIYSDYNEAVKGVAEYFDQIAEYVKNVPQKVIDDAEKAKTEILSVAIKMQMIQKEKSA